MTQYPDSNDYTIEEETAIIDAPNGGVSQVSVSLTLSTKALGADAFIKMEETYDFGGSVSPMDAADTRSQILDTLRDQLLIEARNTVDTIREFVANTPRGNVSVHAVQPQAAPAGAQTGSFAPAQAGPAATVAVANGAQAAPAQSGSLDWRSVPSKFGDGELRFITTASMPTFQMEQEIAAWLRGHGLNPDAFKVFDNRIGPKGLEAGVPNGCVAAVKVARDAEAYVNADIARNAVARVKHNSNGTCYIYFTKEAEAAFKYGALDALKVQ